MPQWEYQITVHELPVSKFGNEKEIIECDQSGRCFVHDTSSAGLGWLETLFCEKGRDGWELVQSGYHNREILCIWKKQTEEAKKD